MASVLSFPSSLRLNSWCWSGDNLLRLWHLLFTDMEGNIPFLTCHLFFSSYLCPVSSSHHESKYLPYVITCYLVQNTCPLQLLSPGYTFQSFYHSFWLCVMLWFMKSNVYLVFVSFLAQSSSNLCNFVSDENNKGVFCYVNEVTFGPHLRWQPGCQEDKPCD